MLFSRPVFRLPARIASAVAFVERHERLLWSLHSLWALALGIGVMWLGARNYAYLRVTLFHIAFLWVTSRIVPALTDRAGETSAWRGRVRLVLNYFNKNFYQQLLFFLLPIYWASVTPWSPNLVFVLVLGGSALVSTLDLFYDRHLSVRRGLSGVFFAFNLFACINVMLPTLWSISHRVSLPLSAALGVLAFATIRYRWRDLRAPHVRTSVGLAAIVLVLVVGLGRPFIPPAPLKIVSAQLGTGINRRALSVSGAVESLPSGWSGRVYALTAIYAPLGLKDRMVHRWYRDGHLLWTSPAYVLTGGRKEGFRLWTSVSVKDVGPGTRLRVDAATEAGQLVGRADVLVGHQPE